MLMIQQLSCLYQIIIIQFSPTPIISSSLNPLFNFLFDASSSIPIILSSFEAESDSLLEEVEDYSNTLSSIPITLFLLNAESNFLLKGVEASSNTPFSVPLAQDAKDQKSIPYNNKTCYKKYLINYVIRRHFRKDY